MQLQKLIYSTTMWFHYRLLVDFNDIIVPFTCRLWSYQITKEEAIHLFSTKISEIGLYNSYYIQTCHNIIIMNIIQRNNKVTSEK